MSQEERLARVKNIIELLYGPRGGSEAARRLNMEPTQLAMTLRGERKVTPAIEGKIAKLALADAVRIAADAGKARDLAVDIARDLFGPDIAAQLTQ